LELDLVKDDGDPEWEDIREKGWDETLLVNDESDDESDDDSTFWDE
jgi:hypothetical protein